jgi:hypothetical protein
MLIDPPVLQAGKKTTHQSKNYTHLMQRWRNFLWWKMSTWARFHRWTPGRRTARTRRSPSQGKSSETKEQNCKAHKKKKHTHPPAFACATANQNATSTLLDHESHGES